MDIASIGSHSSVGTVEQHPVEPVDTSVLQQEGASGARLSSQAGTKRLSFCNLL
jgi:hypothetical protein